MITHDFKTVNPSDENNSRKRSERDDENLATFQRGNIETAQRMLDEAARAAGARTFYIGKRL